jgi:dinuclear metal center YbgI/SA1388 family protein
MTATVADILELMEHIAPACLAQQWDNVGLQVGHPQWPVTAVRVALDPTLAVIEEAARDEADLLITHHPLIFRPLKCVDLRSEQGAVIEMALARRIAVFAAHTNLDAAVGGVNDILARRLGVTQVTPLSAEPPAGCGHGAGDPGLGRVGRLAQPVELAELATATRDRLGLKAVKVSGDPRLRVEQVAVCSGSGSGLMKDFFASDAQVYVSGDLHYHDAMDAAAAGRGLIDVGHFASESLVLETLARRLRAGMADAGIQATVSASSIEKDPFCLMF